MELPYDVVEYISKELDPRSNANLAVTCKEYISFSSRSKRQRRREEVLRCARILKQIDDSLETGDYIILQNDEFDPTMLLVLDFLWFNNMPIAYEWVDPELYEKLDYDDIPTLWKFSKKVCEIALGLD